MKRAVFFGASLIILASCGASASEEQTKAAKAMCDCMNEASSGNFDIDYSECDLKIRSEFEGEVSADEGFTVALEEECPDVASKLSENE